MYVVCSGMISIGIIFHRSISTGIKLHLVGTYLDNHHFRLRSLLPRNALETVDPIGLRHHLPRNLKVKKIKWGQTT